MPIRIRPAQVQDIPAMADVIFAGFVTDPLHVAMFPRANQPSYMDWYHQRLDSKLRDPSIRTLVAVDEGENSSVIIAYARWQVPPNATLGTADRAISQVNREAEPPVTFPELANKALVDHYYAEVDKFHKQYVDTKRDVILDMLVTHPQHQRRGAAKLLMQYGFDTAEHIAAEANEPMRRPIFLEATPEGLPLYERLGWKTQSLIKFDIPKFGAPGQDEYISYCMRRE